MASSDNALLDGGFLKSFAFFVALIVAIMGGVALFAPAYFHVHAWWVLGYCTLLTLVTYMISKKGLGNEDFANMTLAATGIRLLLSAVVLFVYLYYQRQNQMLFAFTFFILYFLFIGFEIRTLLAKLRQNSDSSFKQNEQ
ncbi:hypothetical protein [Hugenholtzia roseola]|uniref:hypothetical protein n=1 Tax=Hugenholtzia roseola TaxID=1002 RepID=UPI00047D67E2|nr:hypothetical protein [Hugenholtzia roseola]